jgi:hypothetical protein
MTVRAFVYTHKGVAIGEFVGNAVLSYDKNGVGEMQMAVSTWNSRAREEFFLLGNIITVHVPDLPTWVGVIDQPREWGRRVVYINAYSAEHIMFRRNAPDQILLKGSAGSLVQQIVAIMNSQEDSLIRNGDMWLGGNSREETVSPLGDLLNDVIRIASRSQNDWDITPNEKSGNILLSANWYESQGEDVDQALIEGFNIKVQDRPLVEEGDVFNQITGVGDGTNWPARIKVVAEDVNSRNKYGLRQTGLPVSATTQEYVSSATEAALAEQQELQKNFAVTVVNKNHIFRKIRKGNRLPLQLKTVGFSPAGGFGFNGTVEVSAMAYDSATKELDLTVTEVTDVA